MELNTRTGVVKRPSAELGEIPDGADHVARLIHDTIQKPVEIQGWHHTHHNNYWIVKPDNSCGIEVCSPILKGWHRGLHPLLKVIDAFGQSPTLSSDERCSLHIHVNVQDMSMRQKAAVVGYWIKCEHIFFDAMPNHRKLNRYCQVLGLMDLFNHEFMMDPDAILKQVAAVKYYSVNTYHMMKGRRDTIEFRIADSECCVNPLYAKNWIRLILHFVDCVKSLPLLPYERGNKWSSLLWLDPKDLWSILKFDGDLTPGLDLVRNWFGKRLQVYGCGDGLGVWSRKARSKSYEQIKSLKFEPITDPIHEQVFGQKYIV